MSFTTESQKFATALEDDWDGRNLTLKYGKDVPVPNTDNDVNLLACIIIPTTRNGCTVHAFYTDSKVVSSEPFAAAKARWNDRGDFFINPPPACQSASQIHPVLCDLAMWVRAYPSETSNAQGVRVFHKKSDNRVSAQEMSTRIQKRVEHNKKMAYRIYWGA